MSKNFRRVSFLLIAGTIFLSRNVSADLVPEVTVNTISQQNGKVTGTVTDDFGTVIGASVLIEGTHQGTVTDFDGKFSLDGLKNGDKIQISYIGYLTQTIAYTGQSTLSVLLIEDTKTLDEVVVTALGIKRDKKALGYATQEIKGDALVDARESNVANALSGKVSGLQVVRSSNGPGGSSKIVLRGNSSLTGSNQPLIVVDGIPMDNFTGGVDGIWGGTDMGSGLSDINPEDIESMNVLKGASAAALYGSRAGNGVILVTTKSGKKQKGLGITVNAGLTSESIFLKPELQNSYGQGSTGIYNLKKSESWGPLVAGSQDVVHWDGTNAPLNTYDNIDAFFQTGLSFNEGISLQQSYDGTSVFASINRSDNEGVVPGADLSRTSFTLRGTSEFGEDKRWKLDAKATYMNNKATNRPYQGIHNSSSFHTIYNLPRSINALDLQNSVDENGQMIWWDTESSPQENPYWAIDHRTNEDTRKRLLGNLSLAYKITDWWTLEVKGGTDYYNTLVNEKVYAGGSFRPKGTYREDTESFYENNFSFLTTLKKDNLLDRLGAFLTLGGNLMDQRRQKTSISTGDLSIPNLFSLNNGTSKNNLELNSSNVHRKMNSLYGSLQLNWDGWMFLDVTARNDWSSTMSKINSSYFYPSVSLSGVVSDMVNTMGGTMPNWLTFAKVRASYAEVGNDLSPYQLYTVYSAGKDPAGNPTAEPGKILYNPDVRSELIKSWEAGIDLKFFNNRLGIDAAWYKTNATRQLLDLPMDPFSGYTSKKINAGNIQNSGFEFMVYGTIIENPKGFNWDTSMNLSFNRNKIINLYEGIDEFSLASFEEMKIIAREGSLYGDIYGKKYQRVEEGEHTGKIIVDAQGLPLVTTDTHYLGNQQPDAMIGWSNSFKYKNISLSFLIDARIGGEFYSGTTAILHTQGNAAGTVVNGARDEFVMPNTVVAKDKGYVANNVAVTPELYWGRAGGTNIGVGEQFIYDATNIRLRNVSLGYNLEKKWLKNTPFQRVRLSAVCNNVFMIAYDLPGIDPESVTGTHSNATGFELFSAPTSRSYTFNITVGL